MTIRRFNLVTGQYDNFVNVGYFSHNKKTAFRVLNNADNNYYVQRRYLGQLCMFRMALPVCVKTHK